MIRMKKQKGLTFIALMFMLAAGAFIGLFGMKTLPFYLENASVKAALDGLVGVPNIGKKGKKAMISRLDGQFNIDAVETITGKDIIFKKGKKVWYVTADYEARATLFAEIGIYAHFVKTVEVPRGKK